MPIGARIRTKFPRPDRDMIDAFAELATSDVADAMGRHYMVDSGIRHIGGGRRMAGPALPVLSQPDDNLMIHAAIELAQPGDVLVVSAGGGTETALVGELVSAWAQRRGVAGFVVDGAVRDADALRVPVFARGINLRAPLKRNSGEVGYTVGIGGLSVSPGDIVLADADGMVVVPQSDAEYVLAQARRIAVNNRTVLTEIENGKYDRSWLALALRGAGVREEG